MTRVSKGVQQFNQFSKQLLADAAHDGKNIGKAKLTEALSKLTADGKISKADRKSAQAMLESAPLTAAAREALENFVDKGVAPSGRTNPSNVLNSRLSHSTGGGESVPHPVPVGGSESGGLSSWLGSYGGGE
ncbi:MAG: hypothetical protein HY791_20165 [Deltaproteobacteria bacterium]|nr:hypothetical protein [Deltaproteobacteria bacterium]